MLIVGRNENIKEIKKGLIFFLGKIKRLIKNKVTTIIREVKLSKTRL